MQLSHLGSLSKRLGTSTLVHTPAGESTLHFRKMLAAILIAAVAALVLPLTAAFLQL
jgi:hypothetical protein